MSDKNIFNNPKYLANANSTILIILPIVQLNIILKLIELPIQLNIILKLIEYQKILTINKTKKHNKLHKE